MNVRKTICGLILLLSIASSASFAQADASIPSPEMLSGLTVEKAMAVANTWGAASPGTGVNSFVTPQKIQFEFPDGTKTVFDLPQDRMVVAIAPYIRSTHPCSTHFMSSCRSELTNTPVKVTAATPDGTFIVAKNLFTQANGFLELWLPRNLEIDLIIEARGLKTSGRISTFENSNTCITTTRLH